MVEEEAINDYVDYVEAVDAKGLETEIERALSRRWASRGPAFRHLVTTIPAKRKTHTAANPNMDVEDATEEVTALWLIYSPSPLA
jgi:hypothetical protein